MSAPRTLTSSLPSAPYAQPSSGQRTDFIKPNLCTLVVELAEDFITLWGKALSDVIVLLMVPPTKKKRGLVRAGSTYGSYQRSISFISLAARKRKKLFAFDNRMKTGSIAMQPQPPNGPSQSESGTLKDRLSATPQIPRVIKFEPEQSNNTDATVVTESSTVPSTAGEEVTSKETETVDKRSRMKSMYTPDENETKKGVDASFRVIKTDVKAIRNITTETKHTVNHIHRMIEANTPKRAKQILAENDRLKRENKMLKQASTRSSQKGDTAELDKVKGSRTHISQNSKENKENASNARRKNVNSSGRMITK